MSQPLTFRLLNTLICVSALLGFAQASSAAPIVRLSGTMRDDGGVEHTLAATRPQISDAAQRVVFVSKRDGPAGQSKELWSVPLSGGEPTRLNQPLDFAHPDIRSFAITPDGQTVLYTAYVASQSNRLHLWSVPITGATPAAPITQLSSATMVGGGSVTTFVISPDSARVVFRASVANIATPELFSVALAPSTVLPTPITLSGSITAGGGVDSSGTLVGFTSSPIQITSDSATVLFVADRVSSGVHDLWSVPITGATVSAPLTNLSQILVNGGNLTAYEIAADGVRVVFSADRATVNLIDLWSAPLAPSATAPTITRLSPTFANVFQRVAGFHISPTAPYTVVFRGDVLTATNDELFSVPINGSSAAVRISQSSMVTGGDVYDFHISPDGTRVLFSADAEIDGRFELWSVAPSGGAIAKVSGTMVSGGSVQVPEDFAFSANSQRAVFIANRENASTHELWSADLVGGAPVRLSSLLTGEDVTWFTLLTGGRILYATTPGSNYQLVMTSITGGTSAVIDATVSTTSIASGLNAIAWISHRNDATVNELYGTTYLTLTAALDIDGDGRILSLTDGLLYARWAQGIRGAALVANATAPIALRTTATAVSNYLTRLQSSTGPETTITRVTGHTPIGNDVKLSPTARITPNGSRVLLVDDHENPGQDQLWSYSTSTSAPVKVSNNTTSDPITTLEITPDGSRVVYLQGTTLWSAPVATAGSAVLISAPVIDVGTFKFRGSNQVLFDGRTAAGTPRNLWYVSITAAQAPVDVSGMNVGNTRAVVEYALSADESFVVYRADADTVGQNELYRYTFAPPARVKLSTTLQANGNVTAFAIGTGGAAKVAYRADYAVDERFELLSVAATGGASTLISGAPVTGRTAYAPNLVPTSNRVIFRSKRDDANKIELFAAPIDGATPPHKLAAILAASGAVDGGIEITGNGTHAVFIADRDVTGRKELYSVHLGTDAVTKLSGTTVAGGNTTKFVLNLSGTRVLFRADRETDETYELWSADAATGGAPVKVSGPMAAGGNVLPDFEIDSSSPALRAYFRADSLTPGQIELWSAALTGGTPLRLSGNMVANSNVSYFVRSEIPARIIFRADRESPDVHELWRAQPDVGDLALDIDGDDVIDPATDGVLLARWLLGFRGAALIDQAVSSSPSARRTSVTSIENYLRLLTRMSSQ